MDDRIESDLLAVVRVAEGHTLSYHEIDRMRNELQRISRNGGVLICPPGMNVYRRVGGQWEPLPDRGSEFGAHVVAGKIRDVCCKAMDDEGPNGSCPR